MSYPRAVGAPPSKPEPPEPSTVDEIVRRVALRAPELLGDLLAVLASQPELLRPYRERQPSAGRLARLQAAAGAPELIRTYLEERVQRRYRIAAARAGLVPSGLSDDFQS